MAVASEKPIRMANSAADALNVAAPRVAVGGAASPNRARPAGMLTEMNTTRTVCTMTTPRMSAPLCDGKRDYLRHAAGAAAIERRLHVPAVHKAQIAHGPRGHANGGDAKSARCSTASRRCHAASRGVTVAPSDMPIMKKVSRARFPGTIIGRPASAAAATASIEPQINPAGKLIQTKKSAPAAAISNVSTALRTRCLSILHAGMGDQCRG